MKTSRTNPVRRRLVTAGVTALTVTLGVAMALPAFGGTGAHIVVPPVPGNLHPPAGHRPYLVGHAEGTQDYICMPCPNAITPASMCPASGFAWGFFAPQATLF